MNAYVERFLGSLQSECLDHFLIRDEDHLCYLVESFLNHYDHEERPHLGLDNLPLTGRVAKPPLGWTAEDIIFHERLSEATSGKPPPDAAVFPWQRPP